LRSRLADDERLRRDIEPGGVWWYAVHIFRAERAGDLQEVARLRAQDQARREAFLAEFREAMVGVRLR
jgi:hypothetical protein